MSDPVAADAGVVTLGCIVSRIEELTTWLPVNVFAPVVAFVAFIVTMSDALDAISVANDPLAAYELVAAFKLLTAVVT
tara:strand:+ start:610 stop:843 length:234 start_codon:yes stop_codon:yes gene_type:complete